MNLRFHLPLFGILLLNPISSKAQSSQARLDSLFSILQEENQIKGSVALLKHGKPFYFYSTENKSEPSPRYRIGSISKTFTATLVLQAVEESKLSLEDKLSKWYPAIANAEEISIRMLLAHRSGIHNFTNDAAYMAILEKPQSKEDMLARFALMEADFAPNERMEYSNTNYVLLSYILEDVYNLPLNDLLQSNICQRINLQETYFFDQEKKSDQEVDSYYWTGDWTSATRTDPSIPKGAGGVVSTPLELCKFMRSLHQEELVNEESLISMKPEGKDGLGLFRYPFYERVAYGHNGGIDGFISHASYMPSEDLSIAVCLNATQYPLNDLLIDILSIYFERADYQLPSFAAVSMEEADLLPFTGTYKSSNFPLDIKVFIEAGNLKAQASGQGAFPLKPIGDNQFEFKAASIKITFLPEENTMHFEQGGMKVLFKR